MSCAFFKSPSLHSISQPYHDDLLGRQAEFDRSNAPLATVHCVDSFADRNSNASVSVPLLMDMTASKFARRSSRRWSSAFRRVPARNPIAFAARRSNGPCRTRLIVSSKSSPTSPMFFSDLCGSGSGGDGNVTLRPCLEPISAARSGSECRAHCVAPVTAHAPHRLPFLFFAEHRWDIVQPLPICRSSPFNGGGDSLCRTSFRRIAIPAFFEPYLMSRGVGDAPKESTNRSNSWYTSWYTIALPTAYLQ